MRLTLARWLLAVVDALVGPPDEPPPPAVPVVRPLTAAEWGTLRDRLEAIQREMPALPPPTPEEVMQAHSPWIAVGHVMGCRWGGDT